MRDNLAPPLRAELQALVGAEPVVADFEGTPPALDRYRAALERSEPITRQHHGPAFAFPDPIPVVGDAILVTEGAFSLLHEHFDWAIEEWADIQPVTVTVENGVAVSICHSPATCEAASEAGVFTAESARGRGHAVAVVSRWASAVLEAGRLPMYSTTWDNVASRRVAAKLSLQLYGEDLSLE